MLEKMIYVYSFLWGTYLWVNAKNSVYMMYPIGIIRTLRSGESGKCCNPPVTDPIPMASNAQESTIFNELSASFSRTCQIIKHVIPKIPVRMARVPEKNQWAIAHVIKLIPIYLIRVAKCMRLKFIIKNYFKK